MEQATRNALQRWLDARIGVRDRVEREIERCQQDLAQRLAELKAVTDEIAAIEADLKD